MPGASFQELPREEAAPPAAGPPVERDAAPTSRELRTVGPLPEPSPAQQGEAGPSVGRAGDSEPKPTYDILAGPSSTDSGKEDAQGDAQVLSAVMEAMLAVACKALPGGAGEPSPVPTGGHLRSGDAAAGQMRGTSHAEHQPTGGQTAIDGSAAPSQDVALLVANSDHGTDQHGEQRPAPSEGRAARGRGPLLSVHSPASHSREAAAGSPPDPRS